MKEPEYLAEAASMFFWMVLMVAGWGGCLEWLFGVVECEKGGCFDKEKSIRFVGVVFLGLSRVDSQNRGSWVGWCWL